MRVVEDGAAAHDALATAAADVDTFAVAIGHSAILHDALRRFDDHQRAGRALLLAPFPLHRGAGQDHPAHGRLRRSADNQPGRAGHVDAQILNQAVVAADVDCPARHVADGEALKAHAVAADADPVAVVAGRLAIPAAVNDRAARRLRAPDDARRLDTQLLAVDALSDDHLIARLGHRVGRAQRRQRTSSYMVNGH